MIFDEKQRRGKVINKIKCKVNDLEKVTTYECLNDNNKQEWDRVTTKYDDIKKVATYEWVRSCDKGLNQT